MSVQSAEVRRVDSERRTRAQKVCESCHARESTDAVVLPLSGLSIAICDECQFELLGLLT